jgi:hypothetical protein
MALTDDEKKELRTTMAEGIAEGLALFRSKSEEEAAKLGQGKQPETGKKEGENGDSNGGGLDLPGFLLGRR